jgi:ATP-dependent helicase/nuclease subunit B
MDGAPLNPSRFLSQVKRLFPKVEVETFTAPAGINDVVHACELAALGLTHLGVSPASQLASPAVDEVLSPDLAHRLYGEELNISVSSLERFASCPYKFFLEQGLRLKERKEFLLDVREQGSFQHEVLADFHEELKRDKLKWRDLTPKEARERIARSADKIIPTFANGLLAKSEQNRFIAGTYKEGLQQVITALVEWFATNRFDPEFVELRFGGRNALPAWRMKIDEDRHLVLYGRIDRVDLCRISETEAICIVIDYKSGGKKPDQTLLHYGVQQQLPAYLLALTRIQEAAAHFQVERIIPAGCFYLPLSGKTPAKKSRREAHGLPDEEKRARYKHDGIFDLERLEYFDSSAPGSDSKQFKRRLNKDGSPRGGSFNALWPDDFAAVLERSEELIREFGRRIYGGDIAIKPYKHGTQTPCDWCDFQSVCRFDPWTQPYHVLRKPEKAEPAEGAEG